MNKTANKDRMIYCDNRECRDMGCVRWIKHAPFDEVLTVVRHQLDKNGKCKEKLTMEDLIKN